MLPPKCSRCGGETIEGHVPQRGFFATAFQLWVSGRAERGVLGTKVVNADTRRIQVFRCLLCGHLDSFAIEPARAGS